MVRLLFTCDVECHDPSRPAEWLTGKTRETEWLGRVARDLGLRGVEGLFFADFAGCEKWRDAFLRAIDILEGYRQRIELHIHPANLDWSPAATLPELDAGIQTRVFETAVANYRKILGREPRIFRAGAYGINRDTLDLLRRYGLADSSFYRGRPQVRIGPGDYRKAGVASYPVTVCDYRLFRKYIKHDLNLTLNSVLQKQIVRNDVMLFFHSFSFNRFHRRTITSAANPRVIARWNRVMQGIDRGTVRPVGIDGFDEYSEITGIPCLDMLRNAGYIFLRNHYLLD